MAVSLALRENGRLHAATAERIRTAAKRLGYMPNPHLSQVMAETARSRHGIQDGTLALLDTEPMCGHVDTGKSASTASDKEFHYFVERAGTYGYRMERFCILDPSLSPRRFNSILWSRGIEGLIIPNISGRLFAEGKRTLPIEWEKFCVVEMGGSMLQPDVNRVRHDHYGAMVRALHRLEHLNYRRIGLCMSSEVDLRTHHRWSAAYLLWRALRPAVAGLQPFLVDRPEPRRVVKWVRENRLDAVLSPGGTLLGALQEGGLDVPGEIGFASLDIFGPKADLMTGINQDAALLAASAVDMVVSLIHRRERGVPEHPIELLSIGRWQDGLTVRPQPESDELPDPDEQVLRF